MNGTNHAAGDAPEGIRSLLSDPNGVVMAVTVYRCSVCSAVTETTGEAFDHFQLTHSSEMKKEGQLQMGGRSGGGGGGGGGRKQAPKTNKQPNSRRKPASQQQTLKQEKSDSQQQDLPDQGLESDLDEEVVYQDSEDVPLSAQEFTPVPMPSENVTISTTPAKRQYAQGGALTHIECDVCGAHKSYSYYQRRYGAESCVPCSKFFKIFLYDPKDFSCAGGHNDCPLASDQDQAVCKSCRLTACLNTFVTNIDRYPAVVDYLNKAGRSEDLDRMRQVWKTHLAEQSASGGGSKSASKANSNASPSNSGGRKRTATSLDGQPPGVIAAAKRPVGRGLSIPSASPAGGLKIKTAANLIKNMPKVTFKIKPGSGLLPNLTRGTSLSALSSISKPTKKSITPVSSPTKSPVRASPSARASKANGSSVMDNSLAGHLSRGPNCGVCENCTRNDCGVCFHCKDKRKFGGANKIKKKCLKRVCVHNLRGSNSGGVGTRSGRASDSIGSLSAVDGIIGDESLITADDQSDLTNTNEQVMAADATHAVDAAACVDVGVDEDFEDEDLDEQQEFHHEEEIHAEEVDLNNGHAIKAEEVAAV